MPRDPMYGQQMAKNATVPQRPTSAPAPPGFRYEFAEPDNTCSTMTRTTSRQLRGLFEYMAGWNAHHQHGVTQHETGAMRSAAREGLAILDGQQHPAP